jgi:hypothetical protein
MILALTFAFQHVKSYAQALYEEVWGYELEEDQCD